MTNLSPALPPQASETAPPVPPEKGDARLDALRAHKLQMHKALLASRQQASSQGTVLNAEVEGDPGLLDYLKDAALSIPSGVVEGWNNTLDLSWGATNFAREAWNKGLGEASFRAPTKEERAQTFGYLPVPHEPETGAGKFTEAVSRFVTGFAAAGGALKAGQVLQGASSTARGAAQGFLADFTTSNDSLLGDLFEAYPSLRTPGLELLAADPDDPLPVARLKTAVEGLGFGAVTDSLVHGLRLAAKWYRAKTPAEAAQVLVDASNEALRAAESVESGARETGLLSPERRAELEQLSSQKGRSKKQRASRKEARKLLAEDDAARNQAASPPDISPDTPSAAPNQDAPAHGSAPAQKAPQTAGSKKANNPEQLSVKAVKEMVDKAATADEAVEAVTTHTNLRHQLFDSPQGSNLLLELGDALAAKSLKGLGKEEHSAVVAETAALMQDFSETYASRFAAAQGRADELTRLSREILADRCTLNLMTDELIQIAHRIDSNNEASVDLLKFIQLSQNIQSFKLAVDNAGTATARALASRRIDVTPSLAGQVLGDSPQHPFLWRSTEGADNESALALMAKEGWTPQKVREQVKRVLTAEGKPTAIASLARGKADPSWFNVVLESRTFNLLSGTKTAVFNLTSNVMKTLTMPGELVLGGLINGVRGRGMREVSVGMRSYANMLRFSMDAFRMAYKATKISANILDSAHGVYELGTRQTSYTNIKALLLKGRGPEATLNEGQELLAHAINELGFVTGAPVRLMTGVDEFFKQLNFRTNMYANLVEDGLEKGLKGHELEAYAMDKLRKSIAPTGAAVRDASTQRSLRYAQMSTWTQNLGADTIGNSLLKFSYKHPSIRLIVPFIRTPVNIFRDFLAHSPLFKLSHDYKTMFQNGGEEAVRAQGQIALGTLTLLTGTALAANGLITGSPPTNPKERAQFFASGKLPYAFCINGSYYPYNRLDPAAMFLGWCADLVAAGERMQDGLYSEETLKEAGVALLAAAVNNVTSKTYMQGFSEFVDVMNEPDRYLSNAAGRMLGSFVPLSSLLREGRQLTDPALREVDGIIDQLSNGIPYLSQALPARHNWITGEVETRPFYVGEDGNNPVIDELAELGRSVVGKPAKEIRGVELTSEQYSRFTELHGTIRIGGKTMEQALQQLINSPAYDKERRRMQDPEEGMQGPRSTRVNRIIDRYREAAKRQLQREDPELNAAIIQQARNKRLAKRGMQSPDTPSSSPLEALRALIGG